MSAAGETSVFINLLPQAPSSQPTVTVVVPCFNGGRFLDGLIGSLAQQTLRDFEVIIVDDGSNDDDTLRKLAAIGGRARVIRQANAGLSVARNVGVRAARADMVMVLDCDDTIEPPFLQEAVALLGAATSDVAAVFCHKRLVGDGAGLLERHFNRFDLLFTNPMPSGLLLRKSCWQAAGGYDVTMRDGYEDWEFYIRLMRMGYRAIAIPKPYLAYRVSSTGMLFSQASVRHAALWRAIRRKHADAYRPWAMLRLWRQSRDGSGRVSLAKGLGAYALAILLPDVWFSRLIGGMRRRHLLGGQRAPFQAVAPKSELAV
jgi:glycosyltransferase involved in cell wall biosynthesis